MSTYGVVLDFEASTGPLMLPECCTANSNLDEILLWHNRSIRKEVNDIAEIARMTLLYGDFSDISPFKKKKMISTSMHKALKIIPKALNKFILS